ncbi:MAG: hypothetical protein Q8Q15_03205 [bacterium]|nr:hypothetical protein [bacterium]
MVRQCWLVNLLDFETKTALRRCNKARDEKSRLKKEALSLSIRKLKETTDAEYGDLFNRLVCTKLDSLEKSGANIPANQSKLGYAESVIVSELEKKIDDEKEVKALSGKIGEQKEKQLLIFINNGLRIFGDPEKALAFASIYFEIEERKTDAIWQKSKLLKVIEAGLNGETVNLISIICCINQFDSAGEYTLVPNLFAFKENEKLEPVPLIIDELSCVQQFLSFCGINSMLSIYVADTDYTEIGQFGRVTEKNLTNLETYLQNLKRYVADREGIVIQPISAITRDNSLYLATRERVRESVTKFRDQDFTREWYQKFEQAVEKIFESQVKRKLFPLNEMRNKSLEIARNIWAVNAAQGAVLSNLGQNTILISTERRERDQNYIIDKVSRSTFPPVLYILRWAEKWNRKLTGQSNNLTT